jgi:hypothetical protein
MRTNRDRHGPRSLEPFQAAPGIRLPLSSQQIPSNVSGGRTPPQDWFASQARGQSLFVGNYFGLLA